MATETRVLDAKTHEIRAVEEDGVRKLVGYGAVFDSLSQDLGGFREKIAPGAFDRTLAHGKDVLITMNHDVNLLLGRTFAGTGRVHVDDVGLLYEVVTPDTQAGRDAWTLAARRDLAGSSFTFSVPKGGDRWERDDTGRVRVLTELALYELGPVVTPAYLDTTVAARSLADIVQTESTEDDEETGTEDGGEARSDSTLTATRRLCRTAR